ncbi:unnamed protein product [Pylaiella littoralis]
MYRLLAPGVQNLFFLLWGGKVKNKIPLFIADKCFQIVYTTVTSSSPPVPGATALSLRQLQQNTAAGLLVAPYAHIGAAWPAGSPTPSVVGTRCLHKQSTS